MQSTENTKLGKYKIQKIQNTLNTNTQNTTMTTESTSAICNLPMFLGLSDYVSVKLDFTN